MICGRFPSQILLSPDLTFLCLFVNMLLIVGQELYWYWEYLSPGGNNEKNNNNTLHPIHVKLYCNTCSRCKSDGWLQRIRMPWAQSSDYGLRKWRPNGWKQEFYWWVRWASLFGGMRCRMGKGFQSGIEHSICRRIHPLRRLKLWLLPKCKFSIQNWHRSNCLYSHVGSSYFLKSMR